MDFGLTNSDRTLFAKYMNRETITREGKETLVTHNVLMQSPMNGYLIQWLQKEHNLKRVTIKDNKAYHITEI